MWKRVFGTRSLKNLRTEIDFQDFPILDLPNEIVSKICSYLGFAELVVLDHFGNPRLCSICRQYISEIQKVRHSDVKRFNLRFLQSHQGTGVADLSLDMEDNEMTEKLEKVLSILMRSLTSLKVTQCQFGNFGTDWLLLNQTSLRSLHLDRCNIRNLLIKLESMTSTLHLDEINFDECSIAPDGDRYSHWLSIFCANAVNRSRLRKISISNSEGKIQDMADYAAGFYHFVRRNVAQDAKNFLVRLTVWKSAKRMALEMRPKTSAADANFDPEVDVYE